MGAFEPRAQLVEAAERDLTVVRKAENVLGLDDARIDVGAEGRVETGLEQLHGIAQLLAENAELVERRGIA